MKDHSLYKIGRLIYESKRDMYEGFDDVSLDEEYPVGFDLNEFKNIRSYSGKLKFAESHLGKPIGRGSSRVVYRVDDDKVLKIAKNERGLMQNNAETDWYNDSYYEDIIAKVFDFDEVNDIWVEMELAKRAKKSDFKRLWNVDFHMLSLHLQNKYDQNRGQRPSFAIPDTDREIMDESEDINLLVSFMYDSDSPPGDFSRINSWGLVDRNNNENLVLIDFGLTGSIYDSYYS